MKASALSKKQVVAMNSGEMIGKIVDFEFDPLHYQIESICIKKQTSLLFGWLQSFFNEPRIIMEVSRIISIGTDVVLVDCVGSRKKMASSKTTGM